jgi:hypothetical protein
MFVTRLIVRTLITVRASIGNRCEERFEHQTLRDLGEDRGTVDMDRSPGLLHLRHAQRQLKHLFSCRSRE